VQAVAIRSARSCADHGTASWNDADAGECQPLARPTPAIEQLARTAIDRIAEADAAGTDITRSSDRDACGRQRREQHAPASADADSITARGGAIHQAAIKG